jgi:hypothetical protein
MMKIHYLMMTKLNKAEIRPVEILIVKKFKQIHQKQYKSKIICPIKLKSRLHHNLNKLKK